MTELSINIIIKSIHDGINMAFSEENVKIPLIDRYFGWKVWANPDFPGLDNLRSYSDIEDYYYETFFARLNSEDKIILLKQLIAQSEYCIIYSKRRLFAAETQILRLDSTDSISDKKIDITEYKLSITKHNLEMEFYQTELNKILSIPEVSKEMDENLPSLIPTQENIKVMLMYELGVLDYLKSTYQQLNPTKLAQIVESFTGINQDTIRQEYRAIIGDRHVTTKPQDDPKKVSELYRIMSGMKLVKKG